MTDYNRHQYDSGEYDGFETSAEILHALETIYGDKLPDKQKAWSQWLNPDDTGAVLALAWRVAPADADELYWGVEMIRRDDQSISQPERSAAAAVSAFRAAVDGSPHALEVARDMAEAWAVSDLRPDEATAVAAFLAQMVEASNQARAVDGDYDGGWLLAAAFLSDELKHQG